MRGNALRLSFQARRFAALLALCGIGVLVAGLTVHFSTSAHRLHMVRDGEASAVSMGRRALVKTFQTAVTDLYFLSDMNGVVQYIASPAPENQAAVVKEFSSFLQQRLMYEQIYIMDEEGTVLVGVQQIDGEPEQITPMSTAAAELVAPFIQALACPEGVAYMAISNSLPGEEETHWVQFGVGIRGTDALSGVLMIRLQGNELLATFEQYRADSSTDLRLLSEQGSLPTSREAHPTSEENHAAAPFPELFPEEWNRIAEESEGQFATKNGIFSFATVRPLDEVWDASCAALGTVPSADRPPSPPTEPTWKVVSRFPPSSVQSVILSSAGTITVVGSFALLLLAALSWTLARREDQRRNAEAQISQSHELLSSTLRRYLPDALRERLLGDPARYARLGGESAPVSVLFADLRGFTQFAESHDLQVVMKTLNTILSTLANTVIRHNGVLDKFIGDGLMAFFEASPDDRAAACRAVEAAIALDRAFVDVHKTLDTAGRELGLGIGIASGVVVIGNVGSDDAMDFTVIGDPVNVAARLQSAAAPGEILLDQTTAQHVKGWLSPRRLHAVLMKGKRRPVSVFALRATNIRQEADDQVPPDSTKLMDRIVLSERGESASRCPHPHHCPRD
jgi:class 3 adenylate cyclase